MTKLEVAIRILSTLFAIPGRRPIADVLEAGRAQGVSSRTMRRAKRTLGIKEVRNGPFPAFWESSAPPPTNLSVR